MELFKEVFNIFDSDGKGFFTRDELFEVMKAMGGDPTAQELESVLYELDADGNQCVDFAEFLSKFYTVMNDENLTEVFNQLAIQEEDSEGKMLSLAALEKCFAVSINIISTDSLP